MLDFWVKLVVVEHTMGMRTVFFKKFDKNGLLK